MKKNLVFLVITMILYSCSSVEILTEAEKMLIQSGDAETPFRVLLVTNKNDSLTLRKKAKDVDCVADSVIIQQLVSRMKATMFAESGVGIAAPQIGISRNVFLFVRVDKPNAPVDVAINPKIISVSDETVCFERDGCLSIPDLRTDSKRYPWIEVEYLNLKGEKIREKLTGYSRTDNFVGIIFQHEYDHLQGTLFTDKPCD